MFCSLTCLRSFLCTFSFAIALVFCIPENLSANSLFGSTFIDGKLGLVGQLNGTEGGGNKIHFFDQSRLQVEYLDVLKQKDQRAYESLYANVENLNAQLKEIINAVYKLKMHSDDSVTDSLELNTFFGSVRDYEHLIDLFRGHLDSLLQIPSLREESLRELMLSMDFTPLKSHYSEQLQRFERELSWLKFRIRLPNRAVYEQVGIDLAELKSLKLYTSEQLAEMKHNIALLKTIPTRDRNIINQSINQYTRQMLEAFIDAFGTSEKYRTPSDLEGLKETAKHLEEVFWARSYLRSVYGIPIGSVPVQYNKRIFNLDYLLSSVKVGPVPVYGTTALTVALNLAREAEATLQGKPSGAVDMIGTATMTRNFIVFLTGSRHAETTKKIMIGLVKRDLEEELELTKPGGMRRIRNRYRADYYGTPENKKYFTELKAQTFGEGDGEDIEEDIDFIEADSFKSVLAQCKSVLESLEPRQDEARMLQNSYNFLVSGSQSTSRRKQRQGL